MAALMEAVACEVRRLALAHTRIRTQHAIVQHVDTSGKQVVSAMRCLTTVISTGAHRKEQ